VLHAAFVRSVAFHPKAPRLVSASNDGTIKVWDLESGQDLLTLPGQSREVGQAAFSPDGRWLASVGSDGTLRLWDDGPPGDPSTPDRPSTTGGSRALRLLLR